MKKFAFTLAEVLITIGIIGVVAEMTIPSLMSGVKDQSTVSSLKKAYSTFSQVYTTVVRENGTPDSWALTEDGAGAIKMYSYFEPYLKVVKKCSSSNTCLPPGGYKYLRGDSSGYTAASFAEGSVILADGSLIKFEVLSSNCSLNRGSTPSLANTCGGVFVDVNGNKPPNQFGKDFFRFYFTTVGTFPSGSAAEEPGWGSFSSNCKDKTTQLGFGCAAWVIYNENLDYLKCSDLSWTGKLKCN